MLESAEIGHQLTKQAYARPVIMRRQGACILVDCEHEIVSDGPEEITGEAPQVAGAVKREWPVGGDGRAIGRRSRDLVQQRPRLAFARGIAE